MKKLLVIAMMLSMSACGHMMKKHCACGGKECSMEQGKECGTDKGCAECQKKAEAAPAK